MPSSRPRPPLPDPAKSALFLDFDGTLVEIAPRPEAVVVTPELVHLLARLHDWLGGALALVSGRPVEQLDAFVAPLNLTVAGLHGLDRRLDDGRRERPDDTAAAIARARPVLERFARETPGIAIEDKALTLAVHFRAVPDRAEAAERAAQAALAAAGEAFELLRGKQVVELKPAAGDKGTAIEALMRHGAFRGRRPVVLGDDVTDEAAFRKVNALGGMSVLVRHDEDRPSDAAYGLSDPLDVWHWLESWLSR